MFDLLAQVDPLAAVLGGLWLFAAGMFPLGFMLGAPCSACCNSCELCTEGQLPETLTVTFDGLEDKTPGPDLITLSFSACYGSSAEARVTAPGGDPETDKGPITGVSLEDGGSGYAKIGRVAPTLTIGGGSGTGATFTPTLLNSKDECKIDTWSLKSVAASGGTGYIDTEPLTITVATGDTEVTAAAARIYLDRTPPDVTLDGTASTTVSLGIASSPLDPLEWRVLGVSVTSGGSGYTEGQALTFSTGMDDVTVAAASATARVVHAQPTNAIVTIYTPDAQALSSGTGAVLEPLWELLDSSQWPEPNQKTYRLTGFTVVNGGSGYADYDFIEITFTDAEDGQVLEHAWIDADIVSNTGAIQTVFVAEYGDIYTFAPAGRYVGSRTDALESVTVTYGGGYYKDDPDARYVVVTEPGLYYREDASVPPYVADVTVGIADAEPSDGAGAEISATIDDDTSSPTFGEITALTIDDGGDGYLAWKWLNTKCCGDYYNGISVVVKRNNHSIGVVSQSEPCKYIHRMCGVGNRNRLLGYIEVQYYGPSVPPEVRLVSESNVQRNGTVSSDASVSGACNTTFVTQQLVTNCDEWLDENDEPLEFTAIGGATASVEVGGDYDPQFKDSGGASCHICCKGEDEVPSEIEVSVTDPRATKKQDLSGNYVLSVGGSGTTLQWSGGATLGQGQQSESAAITISIAPCSSQPNPPKYEFAPDGNGCDLCHYECLATAYVTLGTCGYAAEAASACGDCKPTPLCNPSGLSFSLTSTGGCGSVNLTPG